MENKEKVFIGQNKIGIVLIAIMAVIGLSVFLSIKPNTPSAVQGSQTPEAVVKEVLEKMNLKLSSFEAKKGDDVEIPLSSGGVIMFKSDADLDKLAENLQAALETEPFKTEFKTKYSSLFYIDLRVDNKVYYKFK